MKAFEDRIVNEIRSELEMVPPASPAPIPEPSPRWTRFLVAACVAFVLLGGGWWLLIRPAGPIASTVTVVSVTGDTNPEVVDVWASWWKAWTEVREGATVATSGAGGQFNKAPLKKLAANPEVVIQAADLLFLVDQDGKFVGVGEPTQVRLTPHVQIEKGQATVTDCVFLDPVPWPKLRRSASTGGTVRFTAQLQSTPQGWRISQFEPKDLIGQLTGDTCEPGER